MRVVNPVGGGRVQIHVGPVNEATLEVRKLGQLMVVRSGLWVGNEAAETSRIPSSRQRNDAEGNDASMKPKSPKVAVHVVIFIVLTVAMSALSIWLGYRNG